MKGAAPHLRGRGRPAQAARPRQHLLSGAPGEGQQADPGRFNVSLDEMGDPAGQRSRLARTRAGQDQERATPVLDRGPLLLIQGEHMFPG